MALLSSDSYFLRSVMSWKFAQRKMTWLLKFLDALCERTESLRIYILAWDFHVVFALEREWMQELKFNWSTNERLT